MVDGAVRLVVIGDGLAAGVGDFALTSEAQRDSYPALAAAALGIRFDQPLIEPPGLGAIAGLPTLPVVAPNIHQSTVLEGFPGAGPFHNLALPGLTVHRAASSRVTPPLVHRADHLQTLLNLTLGMPGLGRAATAGSVADAVAALNPSHLLLALGYDDLLERATGAATQTDADDLARGIASVLAATGFEGALIVATVPDPMDSAFFSSIETAARILKTEPRFLSDRFNLVEGDRITVAGLFEIGCQLAAREVSGVLSPADRVSGAQADRISAQAAQLNRGLRQLASDRGGHVLDLHAVFRRLRKDGIVAGPKTLSADYLGGFFGLNGFYPGATGNAVMARELVACLAPEAAAAIDVASVAARDANLLARLAPGPVATDAFLAPRTEADLPSRPQVATAVKLVSRLLARTGMGYRVGSMLDKMGQTLQRFGQQPPMIEVPIQTVYPHMFAEKKRCRPVRGVPAGGLFDPRIERPLELPPGLEQTLPLNPRESYFGDAIRIVDAPRDEPMFAGFPAFGLSGNLGFGGLAMTDSRLSGEVRIRFSEPDERGRVRFEIRHPKPLVGSDGVLTTPQLFRMPVRLNRVMEVPGLVSRGELELATGVVRDLHYNVFFWNTAIQTLFAVNPGLPGVPMLFPGPPNAGSAWARFDQRSDGRLDFSFFGQLFLPLGLDVDGEPVRLPLPFATPDLQCASVVARGLSLHPHLQLTTAETAAPAAALAAPEIPTDTVVELTTIGRRTSFGDDFELNVPELGGRAHGRSHLQGRLRVQFGAESGGLVPISLQGLPPGGLLSEHPKPLAYVPPGVTRGMIGFEENLRFPKATYPLRDPAFIDDPFNLCTGMVERATGRVVGPLLYRGMVQQKLFVELIRVEPCTPADTFLYRGPASFGRSRDGRLLFRFDGEVYVPFPEGFRFPDDHGGDGLVVRAGSRLDPFVRFLAATEAPTPEGVLVAREDHLVSSRGEEFSYAVSAPFDPAAASETTLSYSNHAQGASFELRQVLWMSFASGSAAGPGDGRPETVTLTGVGSWSGDSSDAIHFVTAHISIDPAEPFVGIQIDGGRTSNVNTKPSRVEDSLP